MDSYFFTKFSASSRDGVYEKTRQAGLKNGKHLTMKSLEKLKQLL